MKKKNAAQRLVENMESLGIEIAFGIPGVHTLPIYDALQTSAIRHVLPRHEQGATFMADGYARATGKYAACFVVTGPGILNAATGIGQAYSDSSAMLVVTTANARANIGMGRGYLHETRNQQTALSSITETVLTAYSASSIDACLLEAHTACTQGRKRPAIIEIPLDVMIDEAEYSAFPDPQPTIPVPSEQAVETACEWLMNAKRILIHAGGGGIGASAQIRQLSSHLGAMVTTTIAGKGIVDERSEYALGASLVAPEINEHVEASDLIFVIGSELASRDSGKTERFCGKKIIRLDICARTLVRGLSPSLPLHGDAQETLRLILDRLPAGTSRAPWVTDAPQFRERLSNRIHGERQHQRRFLDLLRSALPDDALVVTDMTQIAYTGNVTFEAHNPASWFHPTGYGTLGWALPAAIGAKLGRPDTPVVALAGDYAFNFTSNELITASDLGLNIPVIIWNNHKPLDVIQEMDAAGIRKKIGTQTRDVDLSALSAAYHCHYTAAAIDGRLPQIIQDAFAADRPTLIEIDASADNRP